MQVRDCEFPDDVYLDVEKDVWLNPLSERQVIIGVTSILSFVAGRIKAINLKKNLAFVKPGQSLATLESAKYFGAIRSPIEAKLIEFNSALTDKPRMINDSPYGDGWLAKMEPAEGIKSYLSKNGKGLMQGKEAASKLEKRIKELKVHCFKKLPDDELVAVGVECSATLSNLNELLKTRPPGTVVHVLSDDPFADIEMIRWSDQTRNELIETRTEGNLHHFIVEKRHD
jgi:glycine cleavage system H protein